MARKTRVEFHGAVYHVIERGDRREDIFLADEDREVFLRTLGEACDRTGWRVHAFVLMRNHYHLLIETPEPNLVAGMKWFQSSYSIRFNRRHHLCGHVFQGRYKAVLIEPEEPAYFLNVADYIHLNPARAGLIVAGHDLGEYRWSSFPQYLSPPRKRPGWLEVGTVLGELGNFGDRGSDRRRLGEYLNQRVANEREPDEETMEERKLLRRGWCLGGEAFRDRMLDLLEAVRWRRALKGPVDGKVRQAHGQWEAERLVTRALKALKLADTELSAAARNDLRKRLIGALVRKHTTASNAWIAERLHMGSPHRVSNYCSRHRWSTDAGFVRELIRLEPKVICTD